LIRPSTAGRAGRFFEEAAHLAPDLAEQLFKLGLQRPGRDVALDKSIHFLLDDAGMLAWRKLARHRIHHRSRLTNQARVVLHDQAVGLGARPARGQLRVVHGAGTALQFEQGFVEFLVVQIVHQRGVGLAQRILIGGLALQAFVHRQKGRARGRARMQRLAGGRRFFGAEAAEIKKGRSGGRGGHGGVSKQWACAGEDAAPPKTATRFLVSTCKRGPGMVRVRVARGPHQPAYVAR
jgi:hypothetical protein